MTLWMEAVNCSQKKEQTTSSSSSSSIVGTWDNAESALLAQSASLL